MSLHPNAVRSSSTDFGAAGVTTGDVLAIETGPNKGNYVIRMVDGHVLFVEEELPSEDAGPVTASVYKTRNKIAYRSAAAVLDQPFFNAGQSRTAGLSIMITV